MCAAPTKPRRAVPPVDERSVAPTSGARNAGSTLADQEIARQTVVHPQWAITRCERTRRAVAAPAQSQPSAARGVNLSTLRTGSQVAAATTATIAAETRTAAVAVRRPLKGSKRVDVVPTIRRTGGRSASETATGTVCDSTTVVDLLLWFDKRGLAMGGRDGEQGWSFLRVMKRPRAPPRVDVHVDSRGRELHLCSTPASRSDMGVQDGTFDRGGVVHRGDVRLDARW
jgi:hypothetical protein